MSEICHLCLEPIMSTYFKRNRSYFFFLKELIPKSFTKDIQKIRITQLIARKLLRIGRNRSFIHLGDRFVQAISPIWTFVCLLHNLKSTKVHFHSKIPKEYFMRIICEVTVNSLHLHSSQYFSNAFHVHQSRELPTSQRAHQSNEEGGR